MNLAIGMLAVMMAAQEQKPATVMVCTPPGPKRPSLWMVDKDGKCPPDTKAMLDKDKKPMYCVNTKHPTPAVCKPSTLQVTK